MVSSSALLVAILLLMALLFLSERLPVDLTALVGLVLLGTLGFLSTAETFSGFSSPTIIAMVSTFVIAAALKHTGVADFLANAIQLVAGKRESLNALAVTLVAAFFSAFMNNIAATALLLPGVVSLAAKASLPQARLLMPLAFGTILGGTTTLIGTPPNILVSDILAQRGLAPFGFLDFTPIGLVIVVFGILYLSFIGIRFLPSADLERRQPRSADLAGVYQLRENTFTLRIPEGSTLIQRSLADAEFGDMFGVSVLAVIRRGKKRLAPRPDEPFEADDVLLCRGLKDDVEALLRFKGVVFEQYGHTALGEMSEEVKGALLLVSGAIGKNLRELNFRERYGLVVVAIERGRKVLYADLSSVKLLAGDRLRVLGAQSKIQEAYGEEEFSPVGSFIPLRNILHEGVFMISVPQGSKLLGKTVGSTRIGELLGLTLLGIARGATALLPVSQQEKIVAHDKLIVLGNPEKLIKLSRISDIDFGQVSVDSSLESPSVGTVEAVLAPRSSLLNKSLKETRFRERFGFNVVSIFREGKPVPGRVEAVPLRFGDALLLLGPKEKMNLLADDPNFVVLTDSISPTRRTSRAVFSVAGLFLMIFLGVTKIMPVHIAAFFGALITILGGAVTMDEVYREIEWRMVILVGALIPVGAAIEHSGLASSLSHYFIDFGLTVDPFMVLVIFCLAASLLSQAFDGALAVILLAPVAFNLAAKLGVSAHPYLMAVALSSSVAFMTPFSAKANLLVMGAGGYKLRHYLLVGTPLTMITLLIVLYCVPLFFPF